MSTSLSGLGLAFVLAALCLSARTANAQAPMTYWIPDQPVAFGGDLTVGQSSNPYGNVPSVAGTGARGGDFPICATIFPTAGLSAVKAAALVLA
jgi:hypothetical protein